MRCHPSKRAFLRRFPAPPPIPDGMVFDPFSGPNGELVSAESVQRRAQARMTEKRDSGHGAEKTSP